MTFDNPNDADNAKGKVNGSIIDGRKVEVRAGLSASFHHMK